MIALNVQTLHIASKRGCKEKILSLSDSVERTIDGKLILLNDQTKYKIIIECSDAIGVPLPPIKGLEIELFCMSYLSLDVTYGTTVFLPRKCHMIKLLNKQGNTIKQDVQIDVNNSVAINAQDACLLLYRPILYTMLISFVHIQNEHQTSWELTVIEI